MSGTDEQVPAPAPAEDELKRRFREALERKNSGGATGSRGENGTATDTDSCQNCSPGADQNPRMNSGARWGGASAHALEIARGLRLGITHFPTLWGALRHIAYRGRLKTT